MLENFGLNPDDWIRANLEWLILWYYNRKPGTKDLVYQHLRFEHLYLDKSRTSKSFIEQDKIFHYACIKQQSASTTS